MNIKEIVDKYILKVKKAIKSINKENTNLFIKNNFKYIVAVSLVFLLFLGYTFGNLRTTKEQLFKTLQVGLENGSGSKLRKVIKIDGEDVSRKELKPLIEYYKDQESKVKNTITTLKEKNENAFFKVVNKNGILGDNYYVDLKRFNLTIKSNYDDVELLLNDKEKINNGETLKDLVPGNYKISGKIKNEFGEINEEKEIVLTKDENIDLKLRGVKVSLSSNVSEGKVLINGEDSGKSVSDFKNIGPMPVDGSVKLSIEKEFPWGQVKSDEVKVLDTPNIDIKMDITNDTLWNEVSGIVNKFYESVFEALNNEDMDLISSTTEECKKKIYSILEKDYLFLKNKYVITNIDIDKKGSHFEYKDGIYKGTVVCDVTYDVSKVLFGIGREEINKKFFTNVIYKDGRWEINNIENFSL